MDERDIGKRQRGAAGPGTSDQRRLDFHPASPRSGQQVAKDHHPPEPRAQIDQMVVRPQRHFADHPENLVHTGRQIGDRAAWEVGKVGRRLGETKQLVGPDVTVGWGHTEQALAQRGTAEGAGLDLGAGRKSLPAQRVVQTEAAQPPLRRR